MDKKNILTYEGLKKLEDELQNLKVVKRKEVAQKIKAEDKATYDKYADYIDAILALVADDPNYAIIDLGPLFS